MSDTQVPAAAGQPAAAPAPQLDDQHVAEPPQPSRWHKAGHQIVHGNILTSILAFVIALVVGAILITFSSKTVQASSGYFFARPGDMLSAVWSAIANAYTALFQGAIVNPTMALPFAPLGDTLLQSAPLIIGGLGLGLGFRAGLFNIGGTGQIVIGSLLCGLIGFAVPLPAGLHVVAAVLGAIVGGAVWGFVPGILRAKTGANEVIVTIMLNSVASLLSDWMLSTFRVFQAVPNQPMSPQVDPSAQLPLLFGAPIKTDISIVLALLCAVGVWWLMERSTLGLRIRAVGENPEAARTAGINVSNVYLWALTIGGALLGLVAATQVLEGFQAQQLTTGGGVAGTFGFDAITVALLGRSKPLGTVLAGLLFGALKAGGAVMAIKTQTPVDVVLVLESVVVLFIAAPPLVRAIFRLPDPERRPSKRALRKAAAHATAEVAA